MPSEVDARRLSGRQAAALLATAGVSRRHARRLLAAGFAGEPVVTGREHWYDEGAVRELLDRPRLALGAGRPAAGACLVVGLRDVSLLDSPAEQRRAVSTGWRMSPWRVVRLGAWMQHTGSLPFVISVAGFVAIGADLVGMRYDVDQDPGTGKHTGGAFRGGPNKPPPRWELDLEEPGEWFATLRGGRLPTLHGQHLRVLPPVGESTA